jgi:diguanylate cyclase (GGDEF)-like protein
MLDTSAELSKSAHRRQMARFSSYLFGGAALVTTLGLVLPHEQTVDDGGLAFVAAAAALVAAVLRLRGERLPYWTFQIVAFTGTLLVSLALLFNGERHGGPAGGDEMYYLWVVLYAAYFFGPLATAAQAALAVTAYAITLVAIDPGPIAMSRWLSTTGLVIGSAVVVRLLSERVTKLVADLERMARTDSLTGLPNRLAFEEQFAREAARAARTRRPFALVLADLDRFKELNDSCGHLAGDTALAQLGKVLPETLRAADVAARVGGDEFAILLPETDIDTAQRIGERIAGVVRERTNAKCDRAVSLSFGVSTFGLHGHTLDDLTRAADKALYEAKRRIDPIVGAAEGEPLSEKLAG